MVHSTTHIILKIVLWTELEEENIFRKLKVQRKTEIWETLWFSNRKNFELWKLGKSLLEISVGNW